MIDINKKIITIGDSHSHWSFGFLPEETTPFIMIHLGARTAWNIAVHDDQVREELAKYPDLPLIFCAGAVDTIMHIYQNAKKKNLTTNQITEEAVNRYVKYLHELQSRKNAKVYAMCLEPAGDVEDPGYRKLVVQPYSFKELDEITLYFNKILKLACEQNDLGYIDMYEEMLDPKTGRRREDWNRVCPSAGRDGFHFDNRVGLAVYEKYFREK